MHTRISFSLSSSHVEHAAAQVLGHRQHLSGGAPTAARAADLAGRVARARAAELDHEAAAEGGEVGVVAVLVCLVGG